MARECGRIFRRQELKPWKRIAEMLDYYAVSREARGTGIGSCFLRLLKEELGRKDICTMIAEVENPDFAKSEAEREERKRRIRFYEKNGLILTEICSCLFGVEYRIMYLPVRGGAEEIWMALDHIYHAMFDEKYFGKEVMLPIA